MKTSSIKAITGNNLVNTLNDKTKAGKYFVEVSNNFVVNLTHFKSLVKVNDMIIEK